MASIKDYDKLECPTCGTLSRPRRVNKRSGSVLYRCDNPNWCQVSSWLIKNSGELGDVKTFGNDSK